MGISNDFNASNVQNLADDLFSLARLVTLCKNNYDVVYALSPHREYTEKHSLIDEVYCKNGIEEFCEAVQENIEMLTNHLPRANQSTPKKLNRHSIYLFRSILAYNKMALPFIHRAVDLAYRDGLRYPETNINIEGHKIAHSFLKKSLEKMQEGESLENIIRPFMPENKDDICAMHFLHSLLTKKAG